MFTLQFPQNSKLNYNVVTLKCILSVTFTISGIKLVGSSLKNILILLKVSKLEKD